MRTAQNFDVHNLKQRTELGEVCNFVAGKCQLATAAKQYNTALS